MPNPLKLFTIWILKHLLVYAKKKKKKCTLIWHTVKHKCGSALVYALLQVHFSWIKWESFILQTEMACSIWSACVYVVVRLRVPHQPPVWADWSPALIKAAHGFTSAAETKAGWHLRECVSHMQTHTLTAYMDRKNQCWSTHIDTHWLKHTLCKKYNRHAQHQMN